MPQNTEIRWIPLRNLEPSDRNARTTAAPAEAMRELEASLEAHGLLENLVVRAKGDGKPFQVVGGGRRLRALRTLAKKRRSRFRNTTPIPCRVIADDAIDEEISAAENLVRVNMHPVDQFAAFNKLLERGLSAREIANRFGLTARTVQRRLRLGGVAPEILSAAREDRLTLELLEAFAATPDCARQLDVWNKMQGHNGYAPTAGWIRNELQQGLVSAASARARFVGLKAYKAAGGTVEEDLFAAEDERSVLICDVKLLSELASKKLHSAGRKLGDGWRWIDTILEAPWDVTRQFGRVKGKPEPPDRGRKRPPRRADGRDRPAQAGSLRPQSQQHGGAQPPDGRDREARSRSRRSGRRDALARVVQCRADGLLRMHRDDRRRGRPAHSQRPGAPAGRTPGARARAARPGRKRPRPRRRGCDHRR